MVVEKKTTLTRLDAKSCSFYTERWLKLNYLETYHWLIFNHTATLATHRTTVLIFAESILKKLRQNLAQSSGL